MDLLSYYQTHHACHQPLDHPSPFPGLVRKGWDRRPPRGQPRRDAHWGPLVVKNDGFTKARAHILKTWLSWNGKRDKLESVKQCKRSKISESSNHSKRSKSSESGEHCKRSKSKESRNNCKRGESNPSIKTASLETRASRQQAWSIALAPCTRAARARRRTRAGAFRKHGKSKQKEERRKAKRTDAFAR